MFFVPFLKMSLISGSFLSGWKNIVNRWESRKCTCVFVAALGIKKKISLSLQLFFY